MKTFIATSQFGIDTLMADTYIHHKYSEVKGEHRFYIQDSKVGTYTYNLRKNIVVNVRCINVCN